MPSQTLPLYRMSRLVHQLRRLSSQTASTPHRAPLSDEILPSIPICPPSSCACAPMPEGLAIDHEKQINGTVPPYAQHVVIRTGRHDWSKRIEDELPTTLPDGGKHANLARSLKGLVGREGKYYDVSIHTRRIYESSMCVMKLIHPSLPGPFLLQTARNSQ